MVQLGFTSWHLTQSSYHFVSFYFVECNTEVVFPARGQHWVSLCPQQYLLLWRSPNLVRMDVVLTGLAGVFVPTESVLSG